MKFLPSSSNDGSIIAEVNYRQVSELEHLHMHAHLGQDVGATDNNQHEALVLHPHYTQLALSTLPWTFPSKLSSVGGLPCTLLNVSYVRDIPHLASMMLELGLLVPGPVGLHLIV